MFYDLNVRRQNLVNPDSLEKTIDRLYKCKLFFSTLHELGFMLFLLVGHFTDIPIPAGYLNPRIKNGYRGFAITTDIDESVFDKSKKKHDGNAGVTSFIPLPPDLGNLKKKFSSVHFYQRINIIISDSSNIRKFILCKNFKKYDLVSFQPENQIVLKSLTSVTDVDIISYNPENKWDLSFTRKLYNQFVNQNVYFELMYAPTIRDSTARRNMLSIAHLYQAIGKSKNVIVTSGAQVATHVRGPYDVINFSFLFGLKEEQSKSSISKNCEKLIFRARKQRRNKTVIEMVQLQ